MAQGLEAWRVAWMQMVVIHVGRIGWTAVVPDASGETSVFAWCWAASQAFAH